MEEKMLNVNAKGGINLENEELLLDYVAEQKCKIEKCTDVSERRVQWLNLALLCEGKDIEREAVDCFRNVLFGVKQLKKQTQEYNICKQAYQGLCRLHSSLDEYVWETASQAIEDAKGLFD